MMWIGEAPGYNEDIEGRPFVGRAGQELHQMAREAGLHLPDHHITNMLMCRPPGNRDPEPHEIENCSSWLAEHIAMVQPKALVLFGRFAIARHFDRHRVAETEGLMYQQMCDTCGGLDGIHLDRQTKDGRWAPGRDPQRCIMQRRLVAAIYHPAATFGNRNPQYRIRIVHQLSRVKAELEHAIERGLL